MNLDKMVTKAYSTNWSKINNFTVQFTSFKSLEGTEIQEKLNLALKGINVPAVVASPIETFLGGRWYYANGRADMARMDMTFRDFDDFHLYKRFVNLFEISQSEFTIPASFGIDIFIDQPTGEPKKFISFKNAVIENISGLSFSNETENQIAEFSVTVKGQRQYVDGTSRYFGAESKLSPVKL